MTFNVPVNFDAGASIFGLTGFNSTAETIQPGGADMDDLPFGWCRPSTSPANAPTGYNGYGVVFTLSMQGTQGFTRSAAMVANATPGNTWLIQIAIDTHASVWIRNFTNTAPWAAWQKLTATTA